MQRAPRGTVDVLPQEQQYWRYVERRAIELCQRFGYQRIDTPMFEAASLFVRSVGGETDIVQKETYTFQDRGGDPLTLRPEGTAPVCRAYLEHGMSNLPQPVRLYYFCPIFRYERPQAGRYRQHHQFGVEAIGDADAMVDAEVIHLAWLLTQELGLKGLSLLVNTIGDAACRSSYLRELKGYYQQHLDKLCGDCRARYQQNPLRLLDCKQETCQPYILQAPHSVDSLCAACREHWDKLQVYLHLAEIPYREDHRLVRGLDYYTRTVFEIQPPDEGGQSTIVGGGRYDGLMEALGGPPTPGIGFGSGIERLILNLKRQGVSLEETSFTRIVIACLGEEARRQGMKLAIALRKSKVTALIAPGNRSLRSQMRYASAMQAQFAIILAEEEMSRGALAVRDMATGTQEEVPQGELTSYLSRKGASGAYSTT